MNERKTENIVRTHFNKYISQIIIEEQASSNPRINKLLSIASKDGTGKGYPEFLIQVRSNPDFLIVIECKANTTKHESANRNRYKDFAVDGALLYSSYLSRDFDVLAIAVSGESDTAVQVSHFLQLKGGKKPITTFGDKLLSVDDYLEGYIKSPEKFRQDYDRLLEFSKLLNEKLHGYKIVESDRGLLISCVLIALENPSFVQTYKNYTNPEDLAKYLVDTVEMEFKNGHIQENKLNILKGRFAFIRTDTSLSTLRGVLSEVITDINENIKNFIKTHEYFDVLGQLYIEFLRYANSDKGLGIVLTPPHVTEFMAELGETNKESVVYDNCTGTGGFLVSAMKVMINDAKGDQDKIKNIKQHQLVGVEYQAHIFALACSNMFIHQDGKSNIIKGSCFEQKIIDEVKTFKPTVGLLNPPYKTDKKDIEELEFILNNLDCLEQGGKCVAIVPLSAALAQTGTILELKKKLLNNHTLDAVLSMPNELFFNSKVSVVSCVMIFTAKRPHPKDKKTFFGYFKDDGFIKRKIKGRIDINNQWTQIKEKWIRAYINKENIAGVSVNRVISATDEWCAEAYMETDYSTINEQIFCDTILTYVSFELLNKIVEQAKSEPFTNKKVDLSTQDWRNFNLTDLFNISASRDELIDDLTLGGSIPYVTSSDNNNGITSFVDEEATNQAGTITANRGGSVGFFFYQPIPYKATPVDVRILTPKFKINTYIGLFLKTVLQLEKYRYNYSRKMGSDRLAQSKIKLPSKEGKPDWQYMEDYIKGLPYSKYL